MQSYRWKPAVKPNEPKPLNPRIEAIEIPRRGFEPHFLKMLLEECRGNLIVDHLHGKKVFRVKSRTGNVKTAEWGSYIVKLADGSFDFWSPDFLRNYEFCDTDPQPADVPPPNVPWHGGIPDSDEDGDMAAAVPSSTPPSNNPQAGASVAEHQDSE